MTKILEDYPMIVDQLKLVLQSTVESKERFGMSYQLPVKTANQSKLWDTLALQLNALIEYTGVDTNLYMFRKEMGHISHQFKYYHNLKEVIPVDTTHFASVIVSDTPTTFHVAFVAKAISDIKLPYVLFAMYRLFEEFVEESELEPQQELRIQLVLPHVKTTNNGWQRRLLHGPEEM
jgi:hypothetical protein